MKNEAFVEFCMMLCEEDNERYNSMTYTELYGEFMRGGVRLI